MINWQKILWDLRRDYKPLERIAKEIGATPTALQKAARLGVKNDLPYTKGLRLIELHNKHCKFDK